MNIPVIAFCDTDSDLPVRGAAAWLVCSCTALLVCSCAQRPGCGCGGCSWAAGARQLGAVVQQGAARGWRRACAARAVLVAQLGRQQQAPAQCGWASRRLTAGAAAAAAAALHLAHSFGTQQQPALRLGQHQARETDCAGWTCGIQLSTAMLAPSSRQHACNACG